MQNEDIMIYENLIDAGLNEDEIERFITYVKQQNFCAQMKFLDQHRQKLLHKMHDKQRQLDCLDYLMHRLRCNATYCSCICEKE